MLNIQVMKELTPKPYLPVPLTVWDNAVVTFLEYKWQQQWPTAMAPDGRSYCCQTRMLVPQIDHRMTKHLLLLPQADAGRVVQLLTGHNFFNYHESLICPSLSALFHFCWSYKGNLLAPLV
jgi:hypothetical protein